MIGFPKQTVAAPQWARRRVAPAFAEQGMVAAAHPLTVETGLEILRRGGNAVDAAVGAGLTAAVVMPEMCGLGGDLFAIVHRPTAGGAPGEVISIQGSGKAPQACSIEMMREAAKGEFPGRGPLSIAVPGMVDAYFALLERFGRRRFADVVEQAIGYAEGFPVYPLGAQCIVDHTQLLSQFPSSASVFLPGGSAPLPGEFLRQPDLARTLRAIADGGRDVFYKGETAHRMTAAIADLGGALSVDDLATQQTALTDPIPVTYRGHTVYQTCLPSQGMILLEALKIVENVDLAKIGIQSAEGIHLLVEAKKLAFADRVGHARDAAFGETPVERLLSDTWARERFACIDRDQAADDVPHGEMRHGDTTYLCVVDGDGMMVSLIQSVAVNFGSGIVAGDTGVLLNNRASAFSLDDHHPNVYVPGKKTIHTLNCYLIADPQGRPVLVGGTPGGDGQPQWNLQTVVGLIDEGWDVQQVAEQPRWVNWPGAGPLAGKADFDLQVERRVGDEVRAALEQRDHRLTVLDEWGAGGAVQVIARDPESGVLAGGSDPRVEGLAMGY